jgi:predicted secreted hydrolase
MKYRLDTAVVLLVFLTVRSYLDAESTLQAACRPGSGGAGQAADELAAAAAWKNVVEPRTFVFPDDHAAHEDYRVEWWYYTGNVQSATGRHFGFELTFFRVGVNQRPRNPSRWTVRDLYIAHFAVADIAARRFHFFERSRRAGIGAAGAASARYHVWNDQWAARLDGATHRLVAAAGNCAIELSLTPQKPPVLHGKRGLSQKGPTVGNASHYYSLTRLQTVGAVTVDGQTFAVSGCSWMDHEFSSSFLEPGQRGWDWMALQLENGHELMIYQIRRNDGTSDVHSSGTIVDPDGQAEPLGHRQFQLLPVAFWRSPHNDARYPVRWTVRLPGRRTELRVAAAFPDQEMNTLVSIGTPYWEGSVAVTGSWQGVNVRGRGYLEMTGYAGKGLGDVYHLQRAAREDRHSAPVD